MVSLRLRRIGISVVGASLLAGATWVLGSEPGQAQLPEPPPPQLTGPALAENLGLQLQPSQPADCGAYVEVNDPAGYCLDAVQSPVERWDVAQRLRGHVPTDLDRQVFQIMYEMAQLDTASDSERLDELMQQLDTLIKQQAQQGAD